MKNYIREGQKLPLYGVGPSIVYGMAVMTSAGIVVCAHVLNIGTDFAADIEKRMASIMTEEAN